MLNHVVSVDAYPVVTEETTVWKCKAVLLDDGGHRHVLAMDPDETFATQHDALSAAVEAIKRLGASGSGARMGHSA